MLRSCCPACILRILRVNVHLSLMRWAGERESGLNVHLSLMRWARIECEFESHAWAGERDMRCECEFELRLKRGSEVGRVCFDFFGTY